MTRRSRLNFRVSRAGPEARTLNNFPGAYPVEPWRAHYWSVSPEGGLAECSAVLELPAGYGAAVPQVAAGEPGCVSKVRSWGVMCSPGVLDQIGFDAGPLVTHDLERFPGGEDQEWLRIYLAATTFELPGHFIIADEDYRFLLFDPAGDLKGSWANGPTYLAALTWLVTHGEVSADFAHLLAADRGLYQRAVAEMLEALDKGDTESRAD